MAAASDTVIFWTILVALILINVTSAAITSELGNQSTLFNNDDVVGDAEASLTSATPDNSYTVLKTFAGILAWSFGLLPAWLDVALLVLRGIAWSIVYKWIRGVSS